MNYLLILLGCQVFHLMEGRVNTALEFARQLNPEIRVDWYLTGGIKNEVGIISEADKMAQLLTTEKQENWSFIMDTWATNTAENFVHIANNISEYDTVYVVTSAFHKERAAKIMELIIPENRATWLVSDTELPDSRYWERIHMRNVDTDVKKAKTKKRESREI